MLNFRNLTTFCLLFFTSCLFAQGWQMLDGTTPFLTHHSYGFGYEGKAYVIQGNFGNPLWLYDPADNSWEEIGDFPGPRRGFAVGDYWDGKYYYGFGNGQNGALNDLWVFDPTDESFTELPACPCPGRAHPAFIAHNDKIMMGTGSSDNGDLSDWWEYDMITQEWTQKQDIPGGRRHHPFFFAAGNSVFLGGGHRDSWFEYNLDTEELTPIDNTPQGRVAGTQFNWGGKGFLLAGDDASHDHVPDNETFMAYNPGTMEWEFFPPLPQGSRWANSSFIIDDILYHFDGEDYDTPDDARTMWTFNLNELNCLPAGSLNASNQADGSVELFWSSAQNKSADTLKYRVQGDSEWITIVDASPVVVLNDLEDCQAYEYQIITSCDSIATPSAIYPFVSSGCGACFDLDYCEPQEFEDLFTLFIDKVGINGSDNISGDDNGYGNFAAPNSETVPIGGDFTLSISVNQQAGNPAVRAWIDLNIDGSFDEDELVLDEVLTNPDITKNISIPATATPGNSRMRVTYATAPSGTPDANPCNDSGLYVLGETEDYCIELSPATNTNNLTTQNDLVAFPNPFKNTIQLEGKLPIHENYTLKVLNIMGETISIRNDFSLSENVDLSHLSDGVYFLQVEDETILHKVRVVKQQ